MCNCSSWYLLGLWKFYIHPTASIPSPESRQGSICEVHRHNIASRITVLLLPCEQSRGNLAGGCKISSREYLGTRQAEDHTSAPIFYKKEELDASPAEWFPWRAGANSQLCKSPRGKPCHPSWVSQQVLWRSAWAKELRTCIAPAKHLTEIKHAFTFCCLGKSNRTEARNKERAACLP